MDGAWALYEAWVKIQLGKADIAAGLRLRQVVARRHPPRCSRCQLDPYTLGAALARLGVDSRALQARAGLDAGTFTEEQIAEVVAANRRAGIDNPHAQLSGDDTVEALLKEPDFVAPLRKHDCPPITDGAAVMILAADDVARELSARPAWIRGIDHRIEAAALGVRDLTRSVSTELAGGQGRRGRRHGRLRRAARARSPTRS